MSTLALIATEYRQTAIVLSNLDLDAQTIADTLESIGGELETKAQSVAFVIRHLEANAATMKEWAKTAGLRAQAELSRADSLRAYLAHAMQACSISKISGPGIALSFRASHVVVFDALALIPERYMHTPEPVAPSPDKEAIKSAIRLGEAVPGAHIETLQSLQIK
jgi:hypothetical protein